MVDGREIWISVSLADKHHVEERDSWTAMGKRYLWRLGCLQQAGWKVSISKLAFNITDWKGLDAF